MTGLMAEKNTWQRVAKRIRVPMGFIVAAVYLWLAHPTMKTLALSLALVLPGLWLRGYAAGYVRKNAEITMTGPYGYTRNPLYLGSMLILLGFGAATGSMWLTVVLLAVFLAIYIPTILGEEAYLRTHFAGFDAYMQKVPRLLPRLTAVKSAAERGSFSRERYLGHREYNASMGACAVYAALVARILLARHSQ